MMIIMKFTLDFVHNEKKKKIQYHEVLLKR